MARARSLLFRHKIDVESAAIDRTALLLVQRAIRVIASSL
jgi:hypothetical protein